MTTNVQGIVGEDLARYINRIERLEIERQDIIEETKQVYSEAKQNGFDPKIMREIVKLRKLDAAERDEKETVIDLYKQALGMI